MSLSSSSWAFRSLSKIPSNASIGLRKSGYASASSRCLFFEWRRRKSPLPVNSWYPPLLRVTRRCRRKKKAPCRLAEGEPRNMVAVMCGSGTLRRKARNTPLFQQRCRCQAGFLSGSQYDRPSGLGVLQGVMVLKFVPDKVANDRQFVTFRCFPRLPGHLAGIQPAALEFGEFVFGEGEVGWKKWTP